ncbi:DUF5330 domain-containing protein [Martelella endophytica]|uniref:DUF5330 domain-containing protein n=1 Tax=Martelella endophytica TaxID=1486262 RepID=UPI000696B583|nr:DUF5330 domain-containing protein [Martelella endophytica]
MRFLLKSAFTIFLLLLVVPFFAPFLLDRPVTREEQAMPSGRDIGGAISAARGTIDYMSGICNDRPDVCEDGAGLLGYLGSRARQGAEIVYLYLGQQFGDEQKPPQQSPKTDRPETTSESILVDEPTVAQEPPPPADMDPVRTGAIVETAPAPDIPGPVPGLVTPSAEVPVALHIPGYPDRGPVPTPRPR